MKMIGTVLAAVAVGTALWTAPALADSIGTRGRLVGIEHNDDASDDFGINEGRAFVDEGGGTVRLYRWGGSLCPGRDLTTNQVEFLLRAMQAKWFVLPYYMLGNGNSRCLVSFGLVTKSSYVDEVTK